MPQKPAKRHVIADVRIETELSQAQLASVLGCATITVRRIEQGTLKLTEKLALKAQQAFDVSAHWLLANDPSQPAKTPRGGLWTKDFYELTSGTPQGHSWRVTHDVPMADAEKLTTAFTTLQALEINAQVCAMLEGARGLPKQGILLHRLRKMLKEQEKDFPLDKKTLDQHQAEIQKARNEYDALSAKLTRSDNEWIWGQANAENSDTGIRSSEFSSEFRFFGPPARRRPGRA
jgi:transcriptional regulator with XRE-family HTH domain